MAFISQNFFVTYSFNKARWTWSRLSFDENVRAKEGGKETTSVPFP